jgi:hypothetical protein
MITYRGTVIATTPTDINNYQNVWLLLPTNAERAQHVLDNVFKTKQPSQVWDSTVLLGQVDMNEALAGDVIADMALDALSRLSVDKDLRQALRITAWLVGRDIRALFKKRDMMLKSDDTQNHSSQRSWLALCIRRGAKNERIISHIDQRIANIMWTLAKIGNRAIRLNDTKGIKRFINWAHMKCTHAAQAFGDSVDKHVLAQMLMYSEKIQDIARKKYSEPNKQLQFTMWRAAAEAAIYAIKLAS